MTMNVIRSRSTRSGWCWCKHGRAGAAAIDRRGARAGRCTTYRCNSENSLFLSPAWDWTAVVQALIENILIRLNRHLYLKNEYHAWSWAWIWKEPIMNAIWFGCPNYSLVLRDRGIIPRNGTNPDSAAKHHSKLQVFLDKCPSNGPSKCKLCFYTHTSGLGHRLNKTQHA